MGRYYIFVGMGLELVGLVLAMSILGSYLDEKYNLNGICLVSFNFFALISWFYHLIVLIRAIDKKTDQKKGDS